MTVRKRAALLLLALCLGAILVVREMARDFDRYWASASAYPADRLLPAAGPDEITELASACWRRGCSPHGASC